MIRDRIRAHQIKNLTLLEIKRKQSGKCKHGIQDMLKVHFKSHIDGQMPMSSRANVSSDNQPVNSLLDTLRANMNQ